MDGRDSVAPRRPSLAVDLGWTIGGVALSVVLGNGCIVLGGVLALSLEAGVSPSAGVALNGIALAAMVAGYSLALTLIARALVARYAVPAAAWLALAVYPLAWSVLVASPGDVYPLTPVLVTGTGALVAWLAAGRAGRHATRAHHA